jgi:iron complex outermembrane receptor protein
MTLNSSIDVVRAQLTSGDESNLPRIPPLRWSIGADVSWRGLNAALTYTRADEQTDTALLELPTQAYDDLRLYAGYSFGLSGGAELELFMSGRNLTDDEQRYHASYIKDFAPQPGRTIEAGVRMVF